MVRVREGSMVIVGRETRLGTTVLQAAAKAGDLALRKAPPVMLLDKIVGGPFPKR
jgi:hypothetical protein